MNNAKAFAILALSLAFLTASPAEGKLRDTTTRSKTDIRLYQDELGFFQKANRDLGDPRFMFSDDGGKYEFGIGGKLSVSGLSGFNGEMDSFDVKFLPSGISVPTDYVKSFASRVSCTLNFKARAKIGKYKVLTFLQIKGNSTKDIAINQAYISLGGFSLGMIPSFFMDLEAGAMSTELAPNNPTDINHTLLGYTHRFKDRLTVGLALENSSLNLDHYSSEALVKTDFQPMPDIAGHIKYKWGNGHVQLGLLYRNLAYWAVESTTQYSYEGWTGHTQGYGISLSSNIKPLKDLKISGQFVYGRGIAEYMPNLSGLNINVGIADKKHDIYNTMGTIPVCEGMLAAQYNWLDNWSASVIGGLSHRFDAEGVESYSTFRTSHYIIGNVFYYIKDIAYAGLEYIYGENHVDICKTDIVQPVDFEKGHANRIILNVVFMF